MSTDRSLIKLCMTDLVRQNNESANKQHYFHLMLMHTAESLDFEVGFSEVPPSSKSEIRFQGMFQLSLFNWELRSPVQNGPHPKTQNRMYGLNSKHQASIWWKHMKTKQKQKHMVL